MNERVSDSRRLATRAASGLSRRMTRTAKLHCRQRRYWYTQCASVLGGPTSAISEKQQTPAGGGEMMCWGYRFAAGCCSVYVTMLGTVSVIRPNWAHETGHGPPPPNGPPHFPLPCAYLFRLELAKTDPPCSSGGPTRYQPCELKLLDVMRRRNLGGDIGGNARYIGAAPTGRRVAMPLSGRAGVRAS